MIGVSFEPFALAVRARSPGAAPAPRAATILASESGDVLLTEAGDNLRQEQG